MNQDNFLLELLEVTKGNKTRVASFMQMDTEKLNHKRDTEAWSVLECIEHLNLYGDFYLPEIQKAMLKAEPNINSTFNPGWLGNYFAESMKPKEQLNKMKTFPSKNPKGSKLNTSVFERFIEQQKSLINLLEQARNKNLQSTSCKITLPLLRFSLGDTLRFTIYHNQRHVLQAERALSFN